MRDELMVVIVVGIVLVAALFTFPFMFYYFMPYHFGAPYSMMTYYGNTIPIKDINVMSEPPSYVRVLPSNNTVIIDAVQGIDVKVYAMMGNAAESVTGRAMPEYSHGDVFVIYGLINPTIVIKSSSMSVELTFTVVNLDDDMYHNFVITQNPPPYPYMMAGMMGNFNGNFFYMMPYLPPTSNGNAYTYSYSISLNYPGTFWYICTYPGHAEEGMYGEIILE